MVNNKRYWKNKKRPYVASTDRSMQAEKKKMTTIEKDQKKATKYYDKFAKIYDLVSSKRYYQKPREFAIEEMDLSKSQIVLNIPCGTGQNFEFFQKRMSNTGKIIGIDLSEGMLLKAKEKVEKYRWENIEIVKEDATQINQDWIKGEFGDNFRFDSILCDLGLSGFPKWELIIDNLISLLKPDGKLVIMDWHIEKRTLRGEFIKWVGKGEVNRPLWQYMKDKVSNFKLNNSFKNGDMFVASGNKK